MVLARIEKPSIRVYRRLFGEGKLPVSVKDVFLAIGQDIGKYSYMTTKNDLVISSFGLRIGISAHENENF